MVLRGQRVLLVSNEAWGPVWYSKHHYAAQLAQRNEVVFLDPPRPWWPGRTSCSLEAVAPRLQVLRYGNAVPAPLRNRLAFEANERLVGARLRRCLEARGWRPTLVWSFDPHRLVEPARLGVRASIYQMMDHYRVRFESRLVRNVDLVLAVTRAVAERRDWGRPVRVVPHAVAEPSLPRDERLRAPGGREAVLVGTFTDRVDYGALAAMAAAEPSCRLRLVGPLQERTLGPADREPLARLRAAPNVDLVGVPTTQDGLQQEILRARLGLCLYKAGAPGAGLSAHKILQYLVLGRQVLTTPLEAYEGVGAGLVRQASTREELVLAFRELLAETDPPEARAARIDFALGFSYERVIAGIEGLLADALAAPRPARG